MSNYCFQPTKYSSDTTPLIQAVRQTRLDVIALLLESGADTDNADSKLRTPLFFANTAAVTKELLKHGANVNHQDCYDQTPLFYRHEASIDVTVELLRHGANVNHRDKTGRTTLFDAILNYRQDLVEILISNGADVNINRASNESVENTKYSCCGLTPLQTALKSFNKLRLFILFDDETPAHRVQRLQNYFDIIKLIVPLCNDFSIAVPPSITVTEPCVVHFFQVETEYGWDDLIVTKYLLRHGACAEFSQFYDCIFNCNFEIRSLTAAFLKLTIMAGCKFNKYFNDIKSAPHRIAAHVANASLVEFVQQQIMDLLSQPLSLQDLTVMAVRKYISSPQLWAKIDTLSVPPLVKHMLKLKTYSESGRIDFDFKCRVYRKSGRTDVRRVQCGTQLCINVCKSIL